MTDAADNDGSRPFTFRIPAWMALLLFAPVVLAIVMYYVGARSLNGVLLPEPRTLPEQAVVVSGGATAAFRGMWTLLYVGKGDCNEACRETLKRTLEVRRSLGTEMARVQRFFVSTNGAPDTDFLAAEQPGLLILTDGLTSRDAVLTTLGEFAEGDVFVADPLGNVVLRYPAGTAMQDMHQDLTLLLKSSQIG